MSENNTPQPVIQVPASNAVGTRLRRRKVMGGAGAAEYAQFVYGNASQQHAAGAGTNVIGMNNPAAAVAHVGGKRGTKNGFFIPTVFLLNKRTKRRRTSTRKTKKRRTSHRRRR